MPAGDDQHRAGFDVGMRPVTDCIRVQMITRPVNDILRSDIVATRHAVQPLALRPLVVGAINRQDEQLLSRGQAVWIIRQGVIVAPQDGLWYQTEFLGNPKDGIPLFHRISDDFGARAGRDGGMQLGIARNAVAICRIIRLVIWHLWGNFSRGSGGESCR